MARTVATARSPPGTCRTPAGTRGQWWWLRATRWCSAGEWFDELDELVLPFGGHSWPWSPIPTALAAIPLAAAGAALAGTLTDHLHRRRD